jgi:hypothetical protein
MSIKMLSREQSYWDIAGNTRQFGNILIYGYVNLYKANVKKLYVCLSYRNGDLFEYGHIRIIHIVDRYGGFGNYQYSQNIILKNEKVIAFLLKVPRPPHLDLIDTIRYGNYKCIRILLNNLSFEQRDLKSALEMALKHKQYRMIRLIAPLLPIDVRTDVVAKDIKDCEALRMTLKKIGQSDLDGMLLTYIRHKNYEGVIFALERGARIQAESDPNGYDILKLAAKYGNLAIIDILIKYGAKINKQIVKVGTTMTRSHLQQKLMEQIQ